ncbi:response regulator, partial [Bacteroidota bacterium]
YEVFTAIDGKKGFELIVTTMPDLIISDIMMPNLNGIDLCKKIKSDFRTEHIPVILLTARSEIEDSIEGYITGADDYIMKPFNSELLYARVNNLIDSRNKLKEHFREYLLMNNENINIGSNRESFVNKVTNLIEKNMLNPKYNVEELASDMGLSVVQLYRKLSTIIGISTGEYIKLVRLKRAAKILEDSTQNDINISEVGFLVGFTNHSHFSQSFKKYFNHSPTEYAKRYSLN